MRLDFDASIFSQNFLRRNARGDSPQLEISQRNSNNSITRKMNFSKLMEKELPRYPRKEVLPLSKTRVKPFDVESTLAEVTEARKCHARKYHGPDSVLYSAIYPIVSIMKALGLAPYDFTGDQLVPSNFYLLFSFVCMAIYSYCIRNVCIRFLAVKREKMILNVVETAKVLVNYLIAMYDLISVIFARKAFCRIWNALQDFDERLSQLGYPRKEVKTRIAAWVLLIVQIVVWTVINQSGMFAFNESWLFNMSYMCLYVTNASSVYKFFGMASFLGQRFHQLNQIARDNLPSRVGYKSTSVSRKTIQELHDELMVSGESLGSLYSWSLFFWLGNLSVHIISNLYLIIDWIIVTNAYSLPWPVIFNTSSWLSGYMGQLLALHLVCDYTITEANFMAVTLVEWDARVVERYPHKDTVRTTLHFLNRRLHFSAGGLFDVKLSLLCSIVGVMSTYLIILLEFPSTS
ncbi:uncharacterized protein LOC100746938 [Bombus impatiens]|uniref:Gustatory receptor n=1 Tax=Bombus impatiens TaxID=132113 RepID=A0A6P3DY41_BOMIM|nr:uncharacterized protein LOC100746938 [Bombus impatiens]